MNNVISFLERKKIKDREHRNKITMPIYDFYIPYEEISFWEQVGEFMQQYEASNWMEPIQSEIDEFVKAFPIDIEMYSEFGEGTLGKFRFLFSHIEINFLYEILLKFECTVYNKEILHYREFLKKMMKDNKDLEKLI